MKPTAVFLASLACVPFTACITPVVHHGYHGHRPLVVHSGYHHPRPIVVHSHKGKPYHAHKPKHYKKAGHHIYHR